MPIEVTMPRLSDTMETGTVIKWNVKEGDSVEPGDVLADIETDKATMELESYEEGTVAKIVLGEGDSVEVGATIMVLAEEDEDIAEAAAASGGAKTASAGGDDAPADTGGGTAVAAPEAPAHAPGTNGAATTGGRVFASPLARKIAEEAGLNLTSVEGTGPGGRIIRKDVEALIGGGPPAAAPAMAPAPAPAAAPASTPAPLPMPAAELSHQVVPLSNMRRTIAKRLVESKTSVPHFQVTVGADMKPLVALRKQLNEQLAAQGVKLSVNDFLVRACALAMHQHPFVNSRWVEQGSDVSIELLPEVNVGVAIALPMERGGGLVVATLRNADRMGLRQISAETKALAEKARTRGLTVEEMADATFTISNLGMFGVDHFTAIINPPNVAILAVGAAIEKPVVKDGELVPGLEMSMTMSSDHRVVDGAMAAAYLQTLKSLLENPATLLV